ncbi:beta-2 adrenergic receptor-like [Anneissia japonica]|uniref:beta-2 adrenergic receptor-like n=1 Tax=Anneissia japonica TaxID=1529436 RepID=UPI0014257A59|nr:beta-2 adrenergic receptor-like [Anneissia japonica]
METEEPTDISGENVNCSWTNQYSNTSIADLWFADQVAFWSFVRNVIVVVFGSIAFIGNVFTFIVALATEKIRKKFSNYQIINLAMKDAIVGGSYVCICVTAFQKLNIIIIFSIILNLMCVSSSLTIIMIAMERCFAIVAPFQHSRYVTTKILTIVIVLDWFVTISLLVITIQITNVLNGLYVVARYVIICAPVLTFIVYLVIILAVRRHASKINQSVRISHRKKSKQNVEIIKTFTLVAGIFIICYFPYGVVNIFVNNRGFSLDLLRTIYILNTLIPLNSAANMFIYWWRIPEFRMAYMRALCCHRNTGIPRLDTPKRSIFSMDTHMSLIQ